MARAFALLWTATATVGLIVRTTSATPNRAGLMAIVAGVYALSLVILVVGRRIPRRAYNVLVAAVTILVGLAQYIATTWPAGQLFLVFYTCALVFAAYFLSARETAFQLLLIEVVFTASAAAGRPDISPWYGLLLAVPLAMLAVLVMTIRGRSVRAEARLEASRRRVVRGNEILEAVAFAAERFLAATSLVETMGDVLARLGSAASVNRVYVFENRSTAQELSMCVRHEWTDGRVASHFDELHEVMLFETWRSPLAAGKPIRMLIRELAEHERAILVATDVRSVLIVPVFVDGEWWGELTFDDCERDRHWAVEEVEALRAAAGTLGAAIQQERAGRALGRRDAILEAVGAAGERLLRTVSLEEEIPGVLERLGRATAVSRVELFETETDEDGQPRTSLRYEWCTPGVEPQIDNRAPQRLTSLWGDALGSGETIVRRAHDFTPRERAVLEPQGIESILVIPIFVGATWFGDIGFDDCTSERTWSDPEVDALRAAAGILGAAIERKRAETAIRAEQERERLLREERARVDRLEELDRLKDELIANVSHELRTPLTSILGRTERLVSRDLDEQTRARYHEVIHAEAERLKRLVDDFLDLQRIEQGRFQPERRPIDLAALLADEVELYAHQSAAHRLELRLPRERLLVLAERERIEQVVGNLLSNAIKYSPEGGSVEIVVEPDDGVIRVSVVDRGLGIPAVDRDRVFSRFFRVDSSDSRRIGGTGLGLALSREIVAAHGGLVGFDSVEGEGSTFWFELPRAEPPREVEVS